MSGQSTYRKTLITNLAVCMVFLSGAAAQVPSSIPPTREPLSISAGPYQQEPTVNSITIMWTTNHNTDGWVEWSEQGTPVAKTVASHDGLIDANERTHKVTIAGLRPAASYQYRVCSRDILHFGAYSVRFGEMVCSERHNFRAAAVPDEEVSFVVFNDIHGRFADFASLLSAARPRYDFAVLNGDMFDAVESESQVISLLQASSRAFGAEVPLIYVRGNHETRGGFARELKRYLSSPQGRYYYSFDYGNVHFIVLDTGEDKLDSNKYYSGFADFDRYRTEQAEWLKQDVQSPSFRKARYRVVLAHMDFPEADGTEAYHGMSDAKTKFGPILDRAGIDLLITAHEHQWTVATPRPGARYHMVRGGGPEAPTLVHVLAGSKGLRVSVIGRDGTVATTRSIFPTGVDYTTPPDAGR